MARRRHDAGKRPAMRKQVLPAIDGGPKPPRRLIREIRDEVLRAEEERATGPTAKSPADAPLSKRARPPARAAKPTPREAAPVGVPLARRPVAPSRTDMLPTSEVGLIEADLRRYVFEQHARLASRVGEIEVEKEQLAELVATDARLPLELAEELVTVLYDWSAGELRRRGFGAERPVAKSARKSRDRAVAIRWEDEPDEEQAAKGEK